MNTIVRYNLTACVLHWSMAAMILAMLFIGVGMVSSVTLRPQLLALHPPLGMAVLVLATARLFNRLRHPPPPLPTRLPAWQRGAAHALHALLYVLMFAMPLLGWATLSAGGYPIVLAGPLHLPAIAPHDPTLYALLRGAHGLFGILLFVAVLGHAAVALVHGLILRDGILQRMLFGRSRRPPLQDLPPGKADGTHDSEEQIHRPSTPN